MTVSNTTTKLTYNGDGANRTFGVTFPLLSANHLRIVVTDGDGMEHEVTANFALDPALAVLTYPTLQSGLAPIPAGSKITLVRQTPQTQEIDLKSGDRMDAAALERGYDKLTYLIQEMQEGIGRALKCKVSETSEHTAEEFLSEITEAVTVAKGAAESSASCADSAQNAACDATAQNTLAQEYASQAASAAENAAQQASNAEQYKAASKNFSDQAEVAKASAEMAKEEAQTAAASASSAITRAISMHNADAEAHEDIRQCLSGKQDKLTAGANIKIEGDVISTTGGGNNGTIDVDGSLNDTSENPVQNKVIKAALDKKQDTLTAGANITIDGKVINASFDTSGLLAKSERGAAGGVASLDMQSKVPEAQLPNLSETYILVAQKGEAGGVAELDATGKVPAERLPVDGKSITVGADGKLIAVGGGSVGSGPALGDFVYSSSSLAADNPGRLPLFTGETICNFDKLYPDFYAWLQNHTELTCTEAEYEEVLAQYTECRLYALTTEDVFGPGVNIATRENAISSGEANFQSGYLNYPFDGEAAGANGTNYWSARGQGDYGNTFVGCYLGNINLTQKVTTIKMAQGIWASSGVSAVKVQYSPDNGTTWQDLATYETPLQANYGDYNVLELPDYTPAAIYGLRVMVAEEPANIRSWWVYELQFLTAGVKTGEAIKLRLPLIKNYIKAANAEDGIKNIEAGLPNVSGKTYLIDTVSGRISNNATAPFYEGPVRTGVTGGTYSTGNGQDFDLSLANPIFGKSATVTPASTTLYPWVVAFNAAVEASVAQAGAFQQALSGKADVSLANVAANIDYVVESYRDEDGNWWRKYKSGWLEQGGRIGVANSTVNQTLTFYKPFASTNYTFLTTPAFTTNLDGGYCAEKSNTSGQFNARTNTGVVLVWTVARNWYACGQGAE